VFCSSQNKVFRPHHSLHRGLMLLVCAFARLSLFILTCDQQAAPPIGITNNSVFIPFMIDFFHKI
jgi:hypothetical protein